MIEILGCFADDGVIAAGAGPRVGEGGRDTVEALTAAYRQAQESSTAFVWVAVDGPTDRDLQHITEVFALDPLQVEDAATLRQRAKAEPGAERSFLVVKVLRYRAEAAQVETDQLSVFTGPSFVVTVALGTADVVAQVRAELPRQHAALTHGPVGVLHVITDRVVDGYLEVCERIEQDVEGLEESVFSPDHRDVTGQIYLLKRENLEVRHAAGPLLPLADDLVHDVPVGLPEPLAGHFRDVAEHLLRTADTVDGVDSRLLALMTVANAQADLKQSADQRRMAAWAALALVPTVIASLYGMNFTFMPELDWRWGYPGVLALMAAAMTLLYRRLRRAGWL